jgi:hypothetical protein
MWYAVDIYLIDRRQHSYFVERIFTMNVFTFLSTVLKGKALVTAAVSVSVLGVAGVALAATPAHELMRNLPGVHATASPTHDANHATPDAKKQGQKGLAYACAGLTEAQQLAAKFSLSTDATGPVKQVICALHDGTFKVTVDGKTLTTDHALGYGEIDLLLTYAQALATKDGTKLTDDNVQKYITTILNTCGSTPIIPCINSKIGGSGHDNGGKPTAIPTPHADGKPIAIPTPHVDGKPIVIPTPPSN